MYPNQEGKDSKPPRHLVVGFKNEKKKDELLLYMVVIIWLVSSIKKKIHNLFMMWSEEKDIKTSRKLAGPI